MARLFLVQYRATVHGSSDGQQYADDGTRVPGAYDYFADNAASSSQVQLHLENHYPILNAVL